MSYQLKKKRIVLTFQGSSLRILKERFFRIQSHHTCARKKEKEMEKKRKELEPEHPSLFYNSRFPELGRSFNDYSIDKLCTNLSFFHTYVRKPDVQPFKNIRYSSEHGCLTMSVHSPSSSPPTSFLVDLSQNLVHGNAHIPELYTRDLISTIGSRNHYSVDHIPIFGENSSIINFLKDWELDLSLKM